MKSIYYDHIYVTNTDIGTSQESRHQFRITSTSLSEILVCPAFQLATKIDLARVRFTRSIFRSPGGRESFISVTLLDSATHARARARAHTHTHTKEGKGKGSGFI